MSGERCLRWNWLASLAVLLLATSARADDNQPKWAPHFGLEAQPGTARNFFNLDFFLPFAQNDVSLAFADLRGRFDDRQSNEGNFGAGYRRMLPGGWNLGGYVYFDRLNTQFNNDFYQVTLGTEALGTDWDARANGYVPVGSTSRSTPSLSRAELDGSSIAIVNGSEQALSGFDAEAGWRVPLWDAGANQQLRIYAGGYRFTGTGAPSVMGPRGRVDLTLYDVSDFWPGTRVSLGAEVEHDKPRGTQAFALLRLTIPFGES